VNHIDQPTLLQIKKIIGLVFPKAQVTGFNRTSLGNVNWVYIIKLKNPVKKLVLKVVYRKDREEQGILAKEVEVISLLNEKKVKGVPKVIEFDCGKKTAPWVYMLESFLEGCPIIECHENYQEKDLESMIKSVARLISGFQKIKYRKITEFEKQRPEFKTFPDYARFYLDKYCRVCDSYGKMPKTLIGRARKFVDKESTKITNREFVLNHSDVSSHNILLKNKKFSGIVDFEATQTMVPEFDLVTFYHEFLWRYPRLWILLLREYVKLNRVPANFPERLNIIMGYRSLRYLYIAVKNQIYQYLPGDIKRMEEVLNGEFIKTINYRV